MSPVFTPATRQRILPVSRSKTSTKAVAVRVGSRGGFAVWQAGINLTRGGQPASIGAEGDVLESTRRFIVAKTRPPFRDGPRLDPSALRCRGDEPAIAPDGDPVNRPAALGVIGIIERRLTQALGRIENRQAVTNPARGVLDVPGHQESMTVGEEGDSRDRPDGAAQACASGLAVASQILTV